MFLLANSSSTVVAFLRMASSIPGDGRGKAFPAQWKESEAKRLRNQEGRRSMEEEEEEEPAELQHLLDSCHFIGVNTPLPSILGWKVRRRDPGHCSHLGWDVRTNACSVG